MAHHECRASTRVNWVAKKNDPFKGSPLNRIFHFGVRPVDRGALGVINPTSGRKKNADRASRKPTKLELARSDLHGPLLARKRQLVKKNGAVVVLPDAPHRQ